MPFPVLYFRAAGWSVENIINGMHLRRNARYGKLTQGPRPDLVQILVDLGAVEKITADDGHCATWNIDCVTLLS